MGETHHFAILDAIQTTYNTIFPPFQLKNLYPILYLMEESLKDGTRNLVSVRKLAALSAREVFKDILPDYQIRHQDYSTVKRE